MAAKVKHSKIPLSSISELPKLNKQHSSSSSELLDIKKADRKPPDMSRLRSTSWNDFLKSDPEPESPLKDKKASQSGTKASKPSLKSAPKSPKNKAKKATFDLSPNTSPRTRPRNFPKRSQTETPPSSNSSKHLKDPKDRARSKTDDDLIIDRSQLGRSKSDGTKKVSPSSQHRRSSHRDDKKERKSRRSTRRTAKSPEPRYRRPRTRRKAKSRSKSQPPVRSKKKLKVPVSPILAKKAEKDNWNPTTPQGGRVYKKKPAPKSQNLLHAPVKKRAMSDADCDSVISDSAVSENGDEPEDEKYMSFWDMLEEDPEVDWEKSDDDIESRNGSNETDQEEEDIIEYVPEWEHRLPIINDILSISKAEIEEELVRVREELAPALKQLTSNCQNLDLSVSAKKKKARAPIGDFGCYVLACALRKNSSLEVLKLRGNEIGDSGFRYLFEALTSHKSISCLNIENNEIGPYGLHHLKKLLKLNRKIYSIIMNQTTFVNDETDVELSRDIANLARVCMKNHKQRTKRCRKTLVESLSKRYSISLQSSIVDEIFEFSAEKPWKRSMLLDWKSINATKTAEEIAEDKRKREFVTKRAKRGYRRFLTQIEGDYEENQLEIEQFSMLKRMCDVGRFQGPYLEVSVLHATNLLPKDKVHNTANPYCKIFLVDKDEIVLDEKKTVHIPNTQNPQWSKSSLNQYTFSDWNVCEDDEPVYILLQLFDKDKFYDVFMGQVRVNLVEFQEVSKKHSRTEKLFKTYGTYGKIPPAYGPKNEPHEYELAKSDDHPDEAVRGSLTMSVVFLGCEVFHKAARRIINHISKKHDKTILLTIDPQILRDSESHTLLETSVIGVPSGNPVRQPTKNVKCCPQCSRTFKMNFRPKHCAKCGFVFCDSCAPQILEEKTRRCCSDCHSVLCDMET